VFLYEDLQQEAPLMLHEMFEFLEVSPQFLPDIEQRYNESGIITNPLLRLVWTKTHPLQRIIRPWLPLAVRSRISQYFISRPKKRLEMPDAVSRRLRDIYRDDISSLQDLINRDLTAWLR
jgi:hypothetical protein